MNRDRWLYVLVALLFVAYVAVDHYAPRPLDWSVSLSPRDKIPFGTYVLYDQLDELFQGEKTVTYQSFYQAESPANQLILTEKFDPGRADMNALLEKVDSGLYVLIAAHNFSPRWMDTLGFEPDFNLDLAGELSRDSIALSAGENIFHFPRTMIRTVFGITDGEFDTLVTRDGKPVVISQRHGTGQLILASSPLIFTNYGLLKNDNYELAEYVLRELPPGDIDVNRYYHVGRPEPATPLRYFIAQPSLRWALYLGLPTLLILLIFGSRRLQRPIPVFGSPENTTLRYVRTIGGLHFRQKNHKSAFDKTITHFINRIQEQYYLRTVFSPEAHRHLSERSGLSREEVEAVFEKISRIRRQREVSEDDLTQLYRDLRKFNLTHIPL